MKDIQIGSFFMFRVSLDVSLERGNENNEWKALRQRGKPEEGKFSRKSNFSPVIKFSANFHQITLFEEKRIFGKLHFLYIRTLLSIQNFFFQAKVLALRKRRRWQGGGRWNLFIAILKFHPDKNSQIHFLLHKAKAWKS